jgi:hypothetical protein
MLRALVHWKQCQRALDRWWKDNEKDGNRVTGARTASWRTINEEEPGGSDHCHNVSARPKTPTTKSMKMIATLSLSASWRVSTYSLPSTQPPDTHICRKNAGIPLTQCRRDIPLRGLHRNHDAILEIEPRHHPNHIHLRCSLVRRPSHHPYPSPLTGYTRTLRLDRAAPPPIDRPRTFETLQDRRFLSLYQATGRQASIALPFRLAVSSSSFDSGHLPPTGRRS